MNFTSSTYDQIYDVLMATPTILNRIDVKKKKKHNNKIEVLRHTSESFNRPSDKHASLCTIGVARIFRILLRFFLNKVDDLVSRRLQNTV